MCTDRNVDALVGRKYLLESQCQTCPSLLVRLAHAGIEELIVLSEALFDTEGRELRGDGGSAVSAVAGVNSEGLAEFLGCPLDALGGDEGGETDFSDQWLGDIIFVQYYISPRYLQGPASTSVLPLATSHRALTPPTAETYCKGEE